MANLDMEKKNGKRQESTGPGKVLGVGRDTEKEKKKDTMGTHKLSSKDGEDVSGKNGFKKYKKNRFLSINTNQKRKRVENWGIERFVRRMGGESNRWCHHNPKK